MTRSLLQRAVGNRHGILPPAVAVPSTPADLDRIHNWSVAYSAREPFRSAGGGVGWTQDIARNSAIAEALERYAAVSYELPIFDRSGNQVSGHVYPGPFGFESQSSAALNDRIDPHEVLTLDNFTLFSQAQRSDPAFPHESTFASDAPCTDVYRLQNNSPALAPAALVGLTDTYGALPTSSGLAAGPSIERALLRALQELIERDAYMSVWLHGLVPPHRELDSSYLEPVIERSGWVVAFDITPAYSTHAVAMIVGNLPMEGVPRVSLGIACRADWQSAADKAFLEWSQGVIFAGHRSRREPGLHFDTALDVRNFDDHAVYYTVHPDRWQELPFMRRESSPAETEHPTPPDPGWKALVNHLEKQGIRSYYRDLTLIDLHQIGLRVVRVLSPDLTPIHSDHRWPHLGGTTADVLRRYPWAQDQQPTEFPSRHPHPLG